jgi:hypothetical protein
MSDNGDDDEAMRFLLNLIPVAPDVSLPAEWGSGWDEVIEAPAEGDD